MVVPHDDTQHRQDCWKCQPPNTLECPHPAQTDFWPNHGEPECGGLLLRTEQLAADVNQRLQVRPKGIEVEQLAW